MKFQESRCGAQVAGGIRRFFLGTLLLFGTLLAGTRASPQSSIAASGNPAAPAGGEQIFADLVKHNELRSTELRQYSAVRTYAVSDPSGKVHAKQIVRMEYIAPDKKTFVVLHEEGSGMIRHLVLNRLMESEASAATGQDHRESSITPANYTFRMLGEEDLGAHHCYLVEATPRHKNKYLFEGKVWIDSREYAVVRIEGHPAKNLSFWITRADFVRQYEKVNDFWLPAKDETLVEVRMYGKKVLSIEHHVDAVNKVLSSEQERPTADGSFDKAE